MRHSSNLEKDFLRHILKSSAKMFESSGSKFFRTTTGIESGPDASDKSRLAMNFLTNVGVKEILYSYRLVLEGKTGKKLLKSSRLEFLEKFSANNFALSDAEDISGLLNRGGKADLTLLRRLLTIHQNLREPSFWEMIDSFILLAQTRLTASKTLLQQLLAYLNFTLEAEESYFVGTNKKSSF